MRTLKSIMLLTIGMMVLMTGFANNPTARDVGPPGTESAKYFKSECSVSPACDLATADYLLENPAVVAPANEPVQILIYVKNEDPAPAAIPGTTVKSRYNLAFLDRHRRTDSSVGEYTNTEAATAFDSHKFADRHRRIRAERSETINKKEINLDPGAIIRSA